jgi:hypothetical protein
MPPVGEAYRLPSVEALIADELGLNPTERVLAQGSRDGVAGEPDRETYQVVANGTGPGMVTLDCLGPAQVWVRVNGATVVSPCLRAGSYAAAVNVRAGDVIEVDATRDTSWRVVVYGCLGCSVP